MTRAGEPATASADGASRDRIVYIGTYTASSESRGIYVCRVGGEGSLTPVQTVEVPNPSWLAPHPHGHVLYAVSEVESWNGRSGGGVTAYAIDATTGELKKINDRPVPGMPAHCAVDPRGRSLIVANYGGGTFAVLGLRPDGGLEPVTDVFTAEGRGPDPQRQAEPHPHQVAFGPGGGYVFGVDLGTDKIWTWRLTDDVGLRPGEVSCSQVASGSGPRHLAFHRNGRFVYVINELASSVTAFAYDSARGAFTWIQTESTAPPGFTGDNFPGEIAAHPSGRFLYGSNRGHDSIVGHRIDEESGTLTVLGWQPTGGQWPRDFTIDPDGEMLLVANQHSDSITGFRIDRETGELHPGQAASAVPAPACVVFGE